MNREYHLAHIIPSPRLHIFQGYLEIIETLRWGLTSLGHAASYAVNQFRQDATNILFGAQMLDVPTLRAMPPDTVVYNLEQAAGTDPGQVREGIRYCADHFEIWEYSEFNLPFWTALNPAARVRHVPVGYAPILSRIGKAPVQDIDVLFYGGPGGNRLRIFEALCDRLVRTVFVHGLYGESRDRLIAQSRIVLNINKYPRTSVFEIARVSYLLANRKAVVADHTPATRIEADIMEGVRLVPVDQVVDTCLHLLEHDAERELLEQRGFELISRRDIRAILAPVLAG